MIRNENILKYCLDAEHLDLDVHNEAAVWNLMNIHQYLGWFDLVRCFKIGIKHGDVYGVEMFDIYFKEKCLGVFEYQQLKDSYNQLYYSLRRKDLFVVN